MVQLKSFKYIEPDEVGRGESSLEPQAELSAEPQAEPQAEPSPSPVSSVSTAGGNLTGSDESAAGERRATFRQADDEATISSGEEYQLAKLDMASEDEEDGHEEAAGRPAGRPMVKAASASALASQLAATPSLARLQPAGHRSQQQLASPRLRQQPRPMSPASLRSRQPAGGDSVSQCSLGQRLLNSNNFEIRWRSISLVASRSRVPAVIADSAIYRLLAGGRDRAEPRVDAKIYYSPPMRHKSALVPATIDEERAEQHWSAADAGPSAEPASHRRILDNVSGSVFSGQLTAVLGPSGVGKTTLLSALTGRCTLEGSGRVSVLGSASRRMSVVSVPQADVLPGKLSAWEDLQFTSRLKNPEAKFEHRRNVERVVRLLQMDKFLHTRIDRLSGGEQRRLSIGRELLSSPDIMILDEPTSGLDANTCKKIIGALRDIVEHSENFLDRPMSIIVTIHQPQQEVLSLFHRCYVMALGGRAIFEGPPSCLLATIVERSSLSRVCPIEQLNENPAIVALEVASGEYGPNVIAELAMDHESQVYEEGLAGELAEGQPTPRSTARRSPLSVSPRLDALHRQRLQQHQESGSSGRPTPLLARRQPAGPNLDKLSNVTSLSYASTYDAELPEQVSRLRVDKRLRRSVVMKSDFLAHTWTLMRRCWLLTTRDTFLMAIRILGFLLVAGGMVQIFAQALDPDEHQCPEFESEVGDVLGFIATTRARLGRLSHVLRQSNSQHLFFFHLVLCITMVTSALTGLVFPLQMRMFMREYKNGWYTPASFTMSQTLAELPVDLIGPVLALLITYPLCQQPSSALYWREAAYAAVLVIASVICKSQAQIVGAIFMDSVQNSVFLSCVAVTPPALLSGIAVRVSQMSQPLQWLSYGSFLRYAFESLFVIRYGYGICPCDPALVSGYPTRTSPDTIPERLDNLARGLLSLNSSAELGPAAPTETDLRVRELNEGPDNLFVRFIRLVTDANNLFVPNAKELGDCASYRSLYLLDMSIQDHILPKWIAIMILMFVISRFLTYFVIKTVIKVGRK